MKKYETGSKTILGVEGQTTWYVVNSNITYTATVTLNGNTTIILKNGCTMSIGEDADGKRINDYGIFGSAGKGLTIYGQSLDDATAGHLKIFTTGSLFCNGISDTRYTQHSGNVTVKATGDTAIDTSYGDITVNGGTLSVTSLENDGIVAYKGYSIIINGGKVNATSNSDSYALWSKSGNVTINGGQVEANGGTGIRADSGNIILGWTNFSDFIHASSYEVFDDHTVQVASGKTLRTDDATPVQVSGTVSDLSLINGKKLTPDPGFTVSADGNTYTIWNATCWDYFCYCLEDVTTYNHFSGKTVKLGADIPTADDIANGITAVTRMAGSDYHDFYGTFDGDGHTLTFAAEATGNYVAPFRNVLGNSSDDHAVIRNLNVVTTITANDYRHTAGLIAVVSGYVDVTNCNVTANITTSVGTQNPSDLYPSGIASQVVSGAMLTVSGCTVGGTFTTNGKFAAGIIGIIQGSASITDCVSSITVQSSVSGDGTHGGFVAVQDNYDGTTLNIEGCVFNGSLLGPSTTNCGGFVGWRSQTVNLSNCLFAPAQVTLKTTGDGFPSATFVRNGDGSISNSYYTQVFGEDQGERALKITAGEGVSIVDISPSGDFTSYEVSGIKAGSNGGLFLDSGKYYGSDDIISVTLGGAIAGAPQGYRNTFSFSGGSVTKDAYDVSTDRTTHRFQMPDANVTVSLNTTDLRSTGLPVSVSYVKADGTIATHDAIALDGTSTNLGKNGQESWYFVGTSFNHGWGIYTYGAVNFILCDGKTMTTKNYDGSGIWGQVNGSLTIYGQTLGTGTLTTSGSDICGGIHQNGSLFICGGIINATGIYHSDISAGDSIVISGGKITATNCDGIEAYEGNITLGWTSADDYIKASAYNASGVVKIAAGQAFIDEDGNIYSGTLNDDEKTAIAGKTLSPAVILADNASNATVISHAVTACTGNKTLVVKLDGRTLYKDGAWNTLCLPFNVTVGSGVMADATAMTLNASTSGFNASTGVLTLYFDNVTSGSTITAGTPFIVKWTGSDVTNPVFSGVTVSSANHDVTSTDGKVLFRGTYKSIPFDSENQIILFLSANNTLYFPKSGTKINPFRAYFQLKDSTAPVRRFVLNFGDDDATRIGTITINREPITDGEWFSLDGRRLDVKPTQKGLYIHGGKKVVVP